MERFVSKEFSNLQDVARRHAPAYRDARPFPSIHFKNFFNAEYLGRVLAEFPDLSRQDAISYDDPREKKLAGKGERSFGEATRIFAHFLNSEPFLQFVQTLTGIKETLLGDPYFDGGSLHEIKKGGLLKIHADFNRHPLTGLDRRVNVLVYLNKDWKEEYGGHFELWDREMKHCVKRILPEFNTLAMFTTTDYSYHGHPDPLNCPEGMSRKSLALYYYSNGRPASEINPKMRDHTTLFQARADNAADIHAMANGGRETFKSIIKDVTPPIVIRAAKRLLG